MARIVGGVAGLLWVAGLVALVIGVVNFDGPARRDYRPPPLPDLPGIHVQYVKASTDHTPKIELATGTVLVGVAGLMAAGLVLVGRAPG